MKTLADLKEDKRDWFTPAEALAYIPVTRRTLYTMLRSGNLQAKLMRRIIKKRSGYKRGVRPQGRRYRIHRDALLEFLTNK